MARPEAKAAEPSAKEVWYAPQLAACLLNVGARSRLLGTESLGSLAQNSAGQSYPRNSGFSDVANRV